MYVVYSRGESFEKTIKECRNQQTTPKKWKESVYSRPEWVLVYRKLLTVHLTVALMLCVSYCFLSEKICSHIILEYAYWNVIPVIRSLHFSFAALIQQQHIDCVNKRRPECSAVTDSRNVPSWRGSICWCCVGSPHIVLLLYVWSFHQLFAASQYFLKLFSFFGCCRLLLL